ncbi:S-adenosyl-L-methionine-dependent methyltransferase [Sistotremastrum niveocremeum HHB9708]|uniref:S-adenosyl-L-methionine-dependent methyltransferase n=1 Tax=Sistotremastrum niveocremeum HHB9708 TaxID=1314777 RepID=A0A164W5J4_9AGAM|nr:S-adenosyl-L-methionine-dependent methyltransferase [Sistotremastrum niveocremeum HHB9708]
MPRSATVETLREFHGRGMNTLSDVYKLPADLPEFDRLNSQHRIWTRVMNGLCPLPVREIDELLKPREDGKQAAILDLGCGSGIWSMQMASLYPQARVVGFDLIEPKPSSRLPNCSFIQGDVTKGLQRFKGQFNIVHLRTLIIHVAKEARRRAILDAIDCLKPGGLIIFAEYDEPKVDEYKQLLLPASDEQDAPPHSWFMRYMTEAFQHKAKTDLRYVIQKILSESDKLRKETIQTSLYHVPVGWDGGNGENGRAVGEMMRANLRDLIRTFRPSLLDRGVPYEVTDRWITKADKELDGSEDLRILVVLYATWARKL